MTGGLLFPPANSNLDGVQVTGTPSSGQVLTATSATAADWQTPFTSGQYLCVPVSYAPSLTTFTTTSATFAAVSSANINTGSFKAPASGSVVVNATFVSEVSNAADGFAYGLCAHGTVTPMVGNIVVTKESSASVLRPYNLSFIVTGLTAGTSYNFDLMFCVASAATLTVSVQNQTGTTPTLGSFGAPATMTVQAV